ncbi:M48 family metalloprotease, partial [Escherichia coli]|nr:M48 family metalloprotease [Escherichia coli]
AVLSEVASGVMNTKTKGKVSLNLEIEPFDENRVKIKHKLSYVRPTNRGKISEEDTTETPMYVNRGMIEAAKNEGEMAGVMAHEISHVALRHATAQQTKMNS